MGLPFFALRLFSWVSMGSIKHALAEITFEFWKVQDIVDIELWDNEESKILRKAGERVLF